MVIIIKSVFVEKIFFKIYKNIIIKYKKKNYNLGLIDLLYDYIFVKYLSLVLKNVYFVIIFIWNINKI